MPSKTLSDKAIAVFAFAAYHQLSSGEAVVDVVLKDAAGHAADPTAITELEGAGLVKAQGERAAFTDAGKARLEAVITALRSA
jgi:chromosome segregation and condensation protein ScpB